MTQGNYWLERLPFEPKLYPISIQLILENKHKPPGSSFSVIIAYLLMKPLSWKNTSALLGRLLSTGDGTSLKFLGFMVLL